MTDRPSLTLTLVSANGETRTAFTPGRLLIAGWTGRDKAAMQHHIDELAALGVTPPAKTPLFYRVAAARLTRAERIEVSGGASSGEAEYFLANIEGTLWVGAGSDHTDREVETYGITVSKQLCDKPIAATLWPLAEVAPHWDRLQIRSHALIEGEEVLYQEGTLAGLLAPTSLLDKLAEEEPEGLQPGDVLFGGTLPALGGVRPAEHFSFTLEDPLLGRRIEGGYRVDCLSIAG